MLSFSSKHKFASFRSSQAQAQVNIQASVRIQPVPQFNPDTEIGASLATRWSTWLDDFEMFLLASGVTDKKQKRALLLYQAGSRVREIFRQLQQTGNDDDYDTAKNKLTEYFEPQKNRRYEVFKFREAKQETNETLDQYHTRLRKLAKTCTFADEDFEIGQQIIMAGTSSRIRKRALRDSTYTLKDILVDGQQHEQSSYQVRDVETVEISHTKSNRKAVIFVEDNTHIKVVALPKEKNAANVAK